MKVISDKRAEEIVMTAMEHYTQHQRSFPWRQTNDPYKIVVSEYMLQQTQTERVVPKYRAFIKKFPNVQKLAATKRREVLICWSGLGYNRRAIALHNTAKVICKKYNGRVPDTYTELITLPGIGPYTANAIMTFAYNKEVIMLETNIRTVIFFHCKQNRSCQIDDTVLRGHVTKIAENARAKNISSKVLYSALMDYGASLKRNGVRLNIMSKHYTKQQPFAGSIRQARGAVLRLFLEGEKGIPKTTIHNMDSVYSIEALNCLVAEGIVEKRGSRYYLIE